MKLTKSTLRSISGLLSLCIVVAPSLTAKLLAQNIVAVTFEPPPGQDAPTGGTAGGASRPVTTACTPNLAANKSSLTALSPGRHIGLTQRDHPIFIVYLPQNGAKTAEFSLFDEKMNGVYQFSVPVADQAGFISIKLPNNAPTLAKDKPYYWTFALVCNESDRTEDSVVGGWIKYSQPDAQLSQQLTKTTLIDRVSLYAQHGFWYDALTTLVVEQKKEPNNLALAKTWAELLQSVGLESIATQPLSAAMLTDTVEQPSW